MSGCCCQSVKIAASLAGGRPRTLTWCQSLQNLVEALILRVGSNFRRNIGVAEASEHDFFSDNTSRRYASAREDRYVFLLRAIPRDEPVKTVAGSRF